MIYISKGVEVKNLFRKGVIVLYCGGRYAMNDKMALLWRRGKGRFAHVYSLEEKELLEELKNKGLVECSVHTSKYGRFYLLTNCLIGVSNNRNAFFELNRMDRRILLWMRRSAFRLNISELIYLTEMKIVPTKSLLGENNRIELMCRIHNGTMNSGKYLEQKALIARCRDEVVESVARLIRKGKLYLI